MSRQKRNGFGIEAWPDNWRPAEEIRQQLEGAGLEDSSWINEGAPHWLLPMEGREHGIAAIWIYPENPDDRESWMEKRFCASVLKEDGLETSCDFETDILMEAIAFALRAREQALI